MENILTIVSFVIAGITTVIGTFTSILTRVKVGKLKNGASLRDRMLIDIMEAEKIYTSFKSTGIDASGFKKSYVLNDLQAYALSQGIPFDSTIWAQEIERMIEFSLKVNCSAHKDVILK